MQRTPYSVSRMLCHIAIGFIGGVVFLGTFGNSHRDQADASLHTEILRFLSATSFTKP